MGQQIIRNYLRKHAKKNRRLPHQRQKTILRGRKEAQNSPQTLLKRRVLSGCSLRRPSQPPACVSYLLRRITGEKQRIDVITAIDHAILAERNRPFGETHCRQPVILRHHDIPLLYAVDEGKIHAVRPLGDGYRRGSLPLKDMGGIAKDKTLDSVFFRQPNADIHHGASIRIN